MIGVGDEDNNFKEKLWLWKASIHATSHLKIEAKVFIS